MSALSGDAVPIPSRLVVLSQTNCAAPASAPLSLKITCLSDPTAAAGASDVQSIWLPSDEHHLPASRVPMRGSLALPRLTLCQSSPSHNFKVLSAASYTTTPSTLTLVLATLPASIEADPAHNNATASMVRVRAPGQPLRGHIPGTRTLNTRRECQQNERKELIRDEKPSCRCMIPH